MRYAAGRCSPTDSPTDPPFISHDLVAEEQIADRVIVMERGTRDAVFDAPHHGYTRALLEATPRPLASLALPQNSGNDMKN